MLQRWQFPRRVLGQWPFAVVMLLVMVGMVRIAQYHWREGTALIGGALLVAAALRIVLMTERAGFIAIRGRAIDVLLYGSFGLCILVVALTITGGPLRF